MKRLDLAQKNLRIDRSHYKKRVKYSLLNLDVTYEVGPVIMIQNPPPVPVVYTMGKVASTSTSMAIKAAGLECHDIHTLNHKELLGMARKWLERGEYPPPHICVSMTHRQPLLIKRQKCFYISLVRDPVARNLSAFFQNLHLKEGTIKNEKNPEKMFEYFSENYRHSLPLTWFDREFKAELGIDIFAHSFDQKARHIHLVATNTILLRVDCPDSVKSRVLSKALGREITVGHLNDGTAKDYKNMYNKMKKLVTFPPAFLDKMYDSKFVHHFWAPDEIVKLKENWVTK